jgi:hypothetical protein
MQMITICGAEQFGEQATKGSLKDGRLADFVILSDNPVTIDPQDISKIQVLETIKEGKSVWVRKYLSPASRRAASAGTAAATRESA